MEQQSHSPSTEVSRRTGPRRKARGRVECRLGAVGQGRNVAEKLLDISESGARLLIREVIAPGRRVELRLGGWGHARPVVVVAKVLWCEPADGDRSHIGVSFEHQLSSEDYRMLT